MNSHFLCFLYPAIWRSLLFQIQWGLRIRRDFWKKWQIACTKAFISALLISLNLSLISQAVPMPYGVSLMCTSRVEWKLQSKTIFSFLRWRNSSILWTSFLDWRAQGWVGRLGDSPSYLCCRNRVVILSQFSFRCYRIPRWRCRFIIILSQY